ncbi:MAG: nitrilase-related carbon-nitrogen hydrolase [Candidatus Thorarchaeota archaeon]|jgi:predicted amidohydrolase/tetratricopeptide (TPR) repeat protein
MMKKGRIETGRVKEMDYNWTEMIKLYKQEAESSLDLKKVRVAARAYKKLGYVHSRLAETVENAAEYIDQTRNAIQAYKKAATLYEQTGNKQNELECLAEAFFFSGFVAGSNVESKKVLDKSHDHFIESSDLFSKENDREGRARTLSRAAMVSFFQITQSNDRREIEKLSQDGRTNAEESWELSKDTGNVQSLVESLYAEFWLSWTHMTIAPFRWDENWKEYNRKLLLKCDESMKITEDCDNPLFTGMVHLAAGVLNYFFGFHFTKDEKKQREYMEKGFQLLEKAKVFAERANNKLLILASLWWLDWNALSTGRHNYIQNQILEDLSRMEEIGQIYAESDSFWFHAGKGIPAFCYANFAQRRFYTTDQRKSFAEKGIEYGQDSLRKLVFGPFSTWQYQVLTWSYSQLAVLTKAKDTRNQYAQKMLQYAQQAQKIGEEYEGGFARAAGYSSAYQAHKTLADIAENEKERIKNLSAAVDAAEKYNRHSVESRTGIVAAQVRLGLLYEELGILTTEDEPLRMAKETFLTVIKESSERGHYFYAAAGHEYTAHIEDRLSNHFASAEHYKKAQEAHTESLRTITYNPLRERVEEKISYACAWNLIEKAKAHHRMSDYQKAKENYEEACEILKELPSYDYEASYYSAWALQEEAEHLSKLEEHKEALDRYETTRESFDSAIASLEKTSTSLEKRWERERIEKLKKVAKVRMNYCSGRADVERARILGKQGEHLAAAERFASAASKFKEVLTLFKIKAERLELEAVYNLCRAWESMELAEIYDDSDRFAEAANLFTKASKLFTDTKLKLLAKGNSAFCKALEHGCKFDESTDTDVKALLYPKIKAMLRKAASAYRKGGYESGADWALATSTYFDVTWHLIKTDEELDIDKKKKLLRIATGYLKSAAELFSKSGHKNKEREILGRLDMVEKEERIIVSALDTITEPSISRSTLGIAAPSCPTETSLSPRISEVRQFAERATRVREEKSQRKYELIYRNLLKEHSMVQKMECRVGIAQIGVSKANNILDEFYEMKDNGLLGLRHDKVEAVKSRVTSMIESAQGEGVNILLFPEMTIDLNYSELLEEITKLAKLHGMYIIPGSYHDDETKQNICVVVGPDGILWKQEKHIPATIQHKGERFIEGIEPGTLPRRTFICDTEFGRIAIVICRDFLDMDLRVELKNFEPPVDLVFNPAFTPVTADFKAAHFDARRSIYAYCFFANVAEFGNSLIYTPEKERTERSLQPKEVGLIYKDVHLFQLRSERKKWEKQQTKKRSFIQSTR